MRRVLSSLAGGRVALLPLVLAAGCAADTQGLTPGPDGCSGLPSEDRMLGVPLGLSADGRFVASLRGAELFVLDRCLRTEHTLGTGALTSISFSDDGERVAAYVQDPITSATVVAVFDRDGVRLHTEEDAAFSSVGPVLSADGSKLALTVSCEGESICPRIASLGGPSLTLPRSRDDFTAWLQASADLSVALVGGARSLEIWRPAQAELQRVGSGLAAGPSRSVMSESGRALLAVRADSNEGVPSASVHRFELSGTGWRASLTRSTPAQVLWSADGQLRFALLKFLSDEGGERPLVLVDLESGAEHDPWRWVSEVSSYRPLDQGLLSRDGQWLALPYFDEAEAASGFFVVRNQLQRPE